MADFCDVAPLVIVGQTPEEFVFAWLHKLRCVSRGLRDAVNVHLHGGIDITSQICDSSMRTLVTETKTFGTAWMMPYFTGAQTFLLQLPQLQRDGCVDDIMGGMQRFSQLEVVQKEGVEVLYYVCKSLQMHIDGTDEDTSDLAKTIESCAWSVIPCLRQFTTSYFTTCQISALCIFRMVFDHMERPHPPPVFADTEKNVLMLFNAITASMRNYPSDAILQQFAVDTLILMMETLADSKARFGEMLRQNGAQSVIEAAVVANVEHAEVIRSLSKATMLFAIPTDNFYAMFAPYVEHVSKESTAAYEVARAK